MLFFYEGTLGTQKNLEKAELVATIRQNCERMLAETKSIEVKVAIFEADFDDYITEGEYTYIRMLNDQS